MTDLAISPTTSAATDALKHADLADLQTSRAYKALMAGQVESAAQHLEAARDALNEALAACTGQPNNPRDPNR